MGKSFRTVSRMQLPPASLWQILPFQPGKAAPHTVMHDKQKLERSAHRRLPQAKITRLARFFSRFTRRKRKAFFHHFLRLINCQFHIILLENHLWTKRVIHVTVAQGEIASHRGNISALRLISVIHADDSRADAVILRRIYQYALDIRRAGKFHTSAHAL